MIWRTATERTSAKFSHNSNRLSTAPARVAAIRGTSISVSWIVSRSAHLAEFFSTFERCGVVSAPCLIMAEHDLTRELPRGPFTFRLNLHRRCRWMRSVGILAYRRRRCFGFQLASLLVQPPSAAIAATAAAAAPAAPRPESAPSAVDAAGSGHPSSRARTR